MAALPARARNHRASAVAASSRLNGSSSEIAARRFSAGVIVAALVRGGTISASAFPTGASRRSLGLQRMAAPLGGRLPPCPLRLQHAEQGPVLVHHSLQLAPPRARPRAARERLGEGDDVAR